MKAYLLLFSLFDFGITTHSFGINIDFPDEKSGTDRPALVFINAVDPTIPVTSNTLPNRRKVKFHNSKVDMESHFEGLSRSKHLGKGYKSVEYVHQVGGVSTDKQLTQDCHLKKQELTKQKPNQSDRSLSTDDTKTTPFCMTNPKCGSYECLFMEALESSQTSTFMCERQVVNSGPKELLKTSQPSDVHLNDKSAGIKVESTSCCDAVPKRLEAETRLATGKFVDTLKETSIPKKESSVEENVEKGTKQPTNIQQTLFTTENDMKPALGDYQAPTNPTTSSTELGEIPIARHVSKPEGTYDKPCSDVPRQSKPKITPRNPKTKISAPKPTLLHSFSQIVKHDDIGNVDGSTDALVISAHQKATAGVEISTEALAVIKPQLMPKPKKMLLSKESEGNRESVKPPVAKVKPTLLPRPTATYQK